MPKTQSYPEDAIPCLDRGFIRLVDSMGGDDAIVQAARVSYGKGTRKVSQDRGLIRYLMRHRHTTPFEMVEFKFHAKMPIFVARQWVRHRTANINEYSLRYSEARDELYNPVTKDTFTAAKGEGAFLNDNPIHCVTKDSVGDMVILNSRSETRRGLWEPFANTFGELRAIGSVAYKLGLTAAGKADIFASLRPKNEWDICAGNCIINEAGGKLIDLNGNIRRYNQEYTIIEPGLIAGETEAVAKVMNVFKDYA